MHILIHTHTQTHTRAHRFEADVLVGTDGIWSKIRKQMLGDTLAHYSEYTVYTVRTMLCTSHRKLACTS
jgi:2-polyprenyl-6-methoxyphenol hydroxylase-like FAD-dependent oxidoreductase